MSIIYTVSSIVIWEIILGITIILGVLFLKYSNFFIRFTKSKIRIQNKFSEEEATHVLLVGSESYSTLKYACLLHEELLKLGIHSFLAELNEYTTYPKIEQLVILSSTYGDGEAPSNATKFLGLFSYVKQVKPYSFSVVGFGSTAYPEFCKFAYAVDNTLNKNAKASQLIPIQTVNNESFEAFSQWANLWAGKNNISLHLKASKIKKIIKPKTQKFEVVLNSFSENTTDNTFVLRLNSQKRMNYNSGDLLAIYSNAEERERLYSISRMNDQSILISVKKHEFGACSTYMSTLNAGAIVNGYLIKNKRFHFPKKKTSKVILIATGTGIGPFLGMIQNNTTKIKTELYWGAKSEVSYSLYSSIIEESLLENKLNNFFPVYSRASSGKLYVQDAIGKEADKFADFLNERGIIMICGSTEMQKSVLTTLNAICIEKLNQKLSVYQNRSQIKMDCY